MDVASVTSPVGLIGERMKPEFCYFLVAILTFWSHWRKNRHQRAGPESNEGPDQSMDFSATDNRESCRRILLAQLPVNHSSQDCQSKSVPPLTPQNLNALYKIQDLFILRSATWSLIWTWIAIRKKILSCWKSVYEILNFVVMNWGLWRKSFLEPSLADAVILQVFYLPSSLKWVLRSRQTFKMSKSLLTLYY